MALYEEEIDLSDYTPEGVEKVDGIPPGWYRAMVADVSIEDRTGALLVKFEVTDGEHQGAHITERLWDPKKADSPDKAEGSRKRRVLWAKRLGLVTETDFGRPGVRIPWDAATGKFFAIQIKERKYKDKDGNERIARNVDYAGVYSLDDQRVPEELRGQAGPGNNVGVPRAAVAATTQRDEQQFDGL